MWPIWQACLTLREEPKFTKSRTDSWWPQRAVARRDTLEPRFTKLRTEFAAPPALLAERMLRPAPRERKSRTLLWEAILPKLRMLSDDPRCTCSTIESLATLPTRVRPATLNAEPILENERIDTVEPSALMSSAETGLLNLTNERTLMLEPRWAVMSTERLAPHFAHILTLSELPMFE